MGKNVAGFMALMLAIHLALGVLLIALSVPLIRRKVPPNPLYGLRVRRTLADPAVWYEANAFAGWGMLVSGCVVAAGSLALYLTPAFQGPAFPVACLALVVISLGLAVGSSFWYLGRIG